MESSISRPLEGTLLAWLTTLYAVLLGLGCLFLALIIFGGESSFSINLINNAQTSFLTGNGTLQAPVIIPGIIALIILIMVASGLFNGKKWAVVMSFIISIIVLINGALTSNYVSFIIAALSLYAGYVCWKSAYYNKAN